MNQEGGTKVIGIRIGTMWHSACPSPVLADEHEGVGAPAGSVPWFIAPAEDPLPPPGPPFTVPWLIFLTEVGAPLVRPLPPEAESMISLILCSLYCSLCSRRTPGGACSLRSFCWC